MKNLIKGVLLVILALPQVSFDCLSQDNETVSMNLDRLKERLGVRFVYDSELGKLLDKNYEGTSVEGLTLEKALGRLLEGTGIKWEVRGGYVVLTRDVPAKKHYTVCGYVTDEATGGDADRGGSCRFDRLCDPKCLSDRPGWKHRDR